MDQNIKGSNGVPKARIEAGTHGATNKERNGNYDGRPKDSEVQGSSKSRSHHWKLWYSYQELDWYPGWNLNIDEIKINGSTEVPRAKVKIGTICKTIKNRLVLPIDPE